MENKSLNRKRENNSHPLFHGKELLDPTFAAEKSYPGLRDLTCLFFNVWYKGDLTCLYRKKSYSSKK